MAVQIGMAVGVAIFMSIVLWRVTKPDTVTTSPIAVNAAGNAGTPAQGENNAHPAKLDHEHQPAESSAYSLPVDEGDMEGMMHVIGKALDNPRGFMQSMLIPNNFRPNVLKLYRAFVTPTCANTTGQVKKESIWDDLAFMEGLLEMTLVPSDVQRTAEEIISNRGYTFEEHIVETQDGFQLAMHRIPNGKDGGYSDLGEDEDKGDEKPRDAVLIVHALFDSSSSYVAGPSDKSLGYVLADAGFDVWLGNVRGNRYSRSHRSLSPDSVQFWDWSFDEIAQFDIPAMVSYISANSSAPRISYIGHSQGATAGLAAFATNPEVASKIALFVALAPVTSLMSTQSIAVKAFQQVQKGSLWAELLGSHEVLPYSKIALYISAACGMFSDVCKMVLKKISGGAEDHVLDSELPRYVGQLPAGTSARNMAHWMQLTKSAELRRYKDQHGAGGEAYDLAKCKVPLAVLYGEADKLVPSSTVEATISKCGNVVASHQIPGYTHLDFIWSQNLGTFNGRIVGLLHEFRSQPTNLSLVGGVPAGVESVASSQASTIQVDPTAGVETKHGHVVDLSSQPVSP